MTVSILVPFTSGCEHRARAREYVLGRYRQLHPEWELVEGVCDGEWSKGAAIADAASRADGDVFVVADADSYTDPTVLCEAVHDVSVGAHPWVVPHLRVVRFTEQVTAWIYDGNTPRQRTVRQPYRGVKGGGITVVSREAWETVHGIDDRFQGWGGEDIAFGWALETLTGPCRRLDGDLHHLWHPPASPRMRGSAESEALASRYRDAFRVPRLMRALVERRNPDPLVELPEPVEFRSRTPNLIARDSRQVVARFRKHEFASNNPDVVDVLRLHPRVTEVATP